MRSFTQNKQDGLLNIQALKTCAGWFGSKLTQLYGLGIMNDVQVDSF